MAEARGAKFGSRAAAGRPEPRVKFINRQQNCWATIEVERLVGDDHPARAIWEFTGQLDLSGFYEPIRAVEGQAGQSAIDPRLLVSLWIYGYSRGIGSAREIARRCEYEPAFQWLCGMEPVNHHTLSDFRVGYDAALRKLFAEVLGVLTAEGLVTLERVMQDGTRIRTQAGAGSLHRGASLRQHVEAARRQVEAMGDPREDPGETRRQRAARERAVRERGERLAVAAAELEKIRRESSTPEQARVSVVEPEARVMKESGGGFAPCYNAQLTTDAAAGAVVQAELSQGRSDYPLLQPALETLEASTGQMPKEVVADGGYTSRENIIALEGKTNFIGSLGEAGARERGQRERRGGDAEFARDQFTYHSDLDVYVCPAGERLKHVGSRVDRAVRVHRYRAEADACAGCAHRPRCCPEARRGRELTRIEEPAAVTRFRTKMQTPAAQQIYRQRAAIAEFPNLWIKEKFGLRKFHVRGLKKAAQELLWVALTYNLLLWRRLRHQPVAAAAVA